MKRNTRKSASPSSTQETPITSAAQGMNPAKQGIYQFTVTFVSSQFLEEWCDVYQQVSAGLLCHLWWLPVHQTRGLAAGLVWGLYRRSQYWDLEPAWEWFAVSWEPLWEWRCSPELWCWQNVAVLEVWDSLQRDKALKCRNYSMRFQNKLEVCSLFDVFCLIIRDHTWCELIDIFRICPKEVR